MKVKSTLNRASLPAAIEQAVKRGYSEEDAERILTAYVDRRFETQQTEATIKHLSHRDPGDEHQEDLDRWADEGGSPHPDEHGMPPVTIRRFP